MNYPVKHFFNTMQGIPQLLKQKGATIEFLKATLITGFNVRPATTINYDSSTKIATATLGVGHGFIVHQIIEVSGADQSEFNNQFRVVSVTGEKITFKMDAVPSTNDATGAQIKVKTAPVGGWEVVLEDTSNFKLAIRRTDSQRSNCVFEIIDNNQYVWSYYARTVVNICSEFNSFDDRVVEESQKALCLGTYNNDNAGFTFLASDKRVFLFRFCNINIRRKCLTFALGEIDDSTVPADKYNAFILKETSIDGQRERLTGDLIRVARNYKQEPGVQSAARFVFLESREFDYPNPQDNGFYIDKSDWIVRELSGIRGFIKGTVNPLQCSSVYFDQVILDLPSLESVPVIFVNSQVYTTDYMVGFRLDSWA